MHLTTAKPRGFYGELKVQRFFFPPLFGSEMAPRAEGCFGAL